MFTFRNIICSVGLFSTVASQLCHDNVLLQQLWVVSVLLAKMVASNCCWLPLIVLTTNSHYGAFKTAVIVMTNRVSGREGREGGRMEKIEQNS